MRNSGQTLSDSLGNTVTQSPPLAPWGFGFYVTAKRKSRDFASAEIASLRALWRVVSEPVRGRLCVR